MPDFSVRKAALYCAALSLTAGGLAACTQTPAPVIAYGYAGGAASSGMHTVSPHETLWSIAQAYRLQMQGIIRLNGLAPPYTLSPGQRLKLPVPRDYTAQAGDSLYSISRLFDVSPTDLARLNHLREPYAMTAGQILRLPELPAPRPLPPPPPAQTRYSVASARDTGQEREDGYPLYGHDGDARPLHAPKRVLPPTVPDGYDGVKPVESTALPLRTAKTRTNLKPERRRNSVTTLPADTPPRAGSRFGWPVTGRVISGYGAKPGGLHNDGINIRAAKGAPVRAADNGVVAYADDQLRGYGNLVLIRHADRWMTAYAHMDRITVKRGQVVHKGERIGTVGTTGGVAAPQLHFEVRHGTEALNPVAFLEKRGS